MLIRSCFVLAPLRQWHRRRHFSCFESLVFSVKSTSGTFITAPHPTKLVLFYQLKTSGSGGGGGHHRKMVISCWRFYLLDNPGITLLITVAATEMTAQSLPVHIYSFKSVAVEAAAATWLTALLTANWFFISSSLSVHWFRSYHRSGIEDCCCCCCLTCSFLHSRLVLFFFFLQWPAITVAAAAVNTNRQRAIIWKGHWPSLSLLTAKEEEKWAQLNSIATVAGDLGDEGDDLATSSQQVLSNHPRPLLSWRMKWRQLRPGWGNDVL